MNKKITNSRSNSVFRNVQNDFFILNCNNPITAIASDLDCRFVVVGGRELFKILEVNPDKEQKLTIKKNLRNLAQAPKQPGISYLEWNPINNYKVIAASVMGTFSLWDFKDGDVRFDKTYKGNNHSINSLNWNPQNEKVFASASHDGVLKIWDIDEQSEKPICMIQKNNECLRVVKFHQTQNLIVAGYESGNIDLFDLRKTGDNFTVPLYAKRGAHNSSILSLDWNKLCPTYLASGSQKKDIKVWRFSENYDESIEKGKIQNLAGVNNIKWRNKKEDEICVSSINFDFTVSVWNVFYEFHPQYVFKGHKDVVHGFVLSPNEDFIITASKDNNLIWQTFSNAYCPFEACNKAALGFNIDDTLIFRSEHQEFKNDRDDSTILNLQSMSKNNAYQNKLGEDFTHSILKRKERRLMLYNIKGLDEELSKFNSIHEEIEFFAHHYKINGDLEIVFEENAKVAETNFEMNVANIWRNTFFILEESKKKKRESKIKNLKTKPLTTDKKIFIENKIHESIKPSNQVQRNLSSPSHVNVELGLNLSNISNLNDESAHGKNPLNLEELYEYLNKNIENLKMNLEFKTFALKNDSLYFKQSFIREFKKNVTNLRSFENKYQNNETNNEEITNKTIVDTLQDLIDNGKIQHAFLIYSTFKNRIKIPDKTLRSWSHGYLELLRTHKLYKIANRCVKDSQINEIKETNKKCAIIYTRCGKCKKVLELDGSYICPKCKSMVRCCICQKPIKGLMIWCQVCSHSGHVREITEWFKKNKECPAGCGHKCFEYYKQINIF